MPRPKVLSHVVFRTSRLDEMVEWYLATTHCRIAFRSPKACFITFDEEHHRIGFLWEPNLEEQTEKAAGLNHVALRFGTLDEVLENYVALRERKIVPDRCTHHGPGMSFYYYDPDHNQVELLYDTLSDEESVRRFVESETFRKNPMGLAFDPEQLLRCAKAGVPLDRLIAYEALPTV